MNAGGAIARSFGSSVIDIADAWGDGKLGVNNFSAPAFAGLEALGLFLDPVNWVVGKLLDPLYEVILRHCEPLRKCIETITGVPEQVRGQADQYQRVSQEIADRANGVVSAVNALLKTWEGEARDRFRDAARKAVQMQKDIADKQHQLAAFWYLMSNIVATVKEVVVSLVKQLVTDLVTKGVMMAAAAIPTLGAAIAAYTAWAAAKYAAVMGRIARWFQKLASQASKAVGEATRLGKLFANIAERLGKIAGDFEAVSDLGKASKEHKQNAKAHDKRRERAQNRGDKTNASKQDTLSKQQWDKRHTTNNDINKKADDYGPGYGTEGTKGAEKGSRNGTSTPDNPADSVDEVID